jgi:nucleoside-diphosphate-sugar epimerase
VTRFTELVDTLKAINPAAGFEIEPDGAAKSKAQAMDITRAREQLGWAPAFSLADGLKDYMEELRAARAFMAQNP